MARQPDIQYIQMYNHGSTARKLAPRPQYRKEKYQLPEQRPVVEQVKASVLDPLSLCALAVAGFMLVAMLIGMFRLGELTQQRQQLDAQISALQQQRADLQMLYEETYDLTQVEERARQMGMVSADEVTHVQMEAVDPDLYQGPGFMERVTAFFDELFAKAPR